MKRHIYNPPSQKDGIGYYTFNYGKKWFSARKNRMRMTKESRKASR
jgi:aminopeptidase-like protein